ncbi:collagen alpha-1(I) chain-like, partial [Dipodomys spectabilis]|uniref:collagen alpha-1(I) chain-like n=1 Tax=Dipodomys spectabilis TaxID=105255 RepID=UPI001C539788
APRGCPPPKPGLREKRPARERARAAPTRDGGGVWERPGTGLPTGPPPRPLGRTGDPRRVFKPPRRNAIPGTWTREGGRARGGVRCHRGEPAPDRATEAAGGEGGAEGKAKADREGGGRRPHTCGKASGGGDRHEGAQARRGRGPRRGAPRRRRTGEERGDAGSGAQRRRRRADGEKRTRRRPPAAGECDAPRGPGRGRGRRSRGRGKRVIWTRTSAEAAGGGDTATGRARGPVRRQQREGGARARPLPATRARNPDPPRPPPQAGGRHDPPATCLNPGNRLAHPAARAPRGRHRTRPHPPGRRRPRDPSRPPYRSFLSSLAPPRQLNPSAAAGNTGTGEGPHRHGRPGNGRVPPPRPAPTCESGPHGDGRRRRRGKDGDDDEEEPRGTAAPETPADRGRPPSRRIVKFDRLLSTPPGPWADPGGADPRASLNHPIEAGPNSLARTDAGAERTATRAAADRRCRQGVGGPRRRPVGDKSPANGGGRRRRQGPREAGDTKPNAREHAHTRTPPAQSGQGQAREPGSRRARGGDTPREHNTPDPGQGRGRSHTARDGGDDAMRASLRTAKREGGAGTRDNIAQAREAAPSGRRHVVTPASGPSDGQLPSEGRTRESHHHRPRGVPAVPLAGTLVNTNTTPDSTVRRWPATRPNRRGSRKADAGEEGTPEAQQEEQREGHRVGSPGREASERAATPSHGRVAQPQTNGEVGPFRAQPARQVNERGISPPPTPGRSRATPGTPSRPTSGPETPTAAAAGPPKRGPRGKRQLSHTPQRPRERPRSRPRQQGPTASIHTTPPGTAPIIDRLFFGRVSKGPHTPGSSAPGGQNTPERRTTTGTAAPEHRGAQRPHGAVVANGRRPTQTLGNSVARGRRGRGTGPPKTPRQPKHEARKPHTTRPRIATRHGLQAPPLDTPHARQGRGRIGNVLHSPHQTTARERPESREGRRTRRRAQTELLVDPTKLPPPAQTGHRRESGDARPHPALACGRKVRQNSRPGATATPRRQSRPAPGRGRASARLAAARPPPPPLARSAENEGTVISKRTPGGARQPPSNDRLHRAAVPRIGARRPALSSGDTEHGNKSPHSPPPRTEWHNL